MFRCLTLFVILVVSSPAVALQADKAEKQKQEEAKKRREAELQRKFDLLPGDVQQQIRILRKAIKQEGIEKTLDANGEFVQKYMEFFWTDEMQAYFVKKADALGAGEILKTLGLDKRKDVVQLKLRFYKQSNKLEAADVLQIAKKIKAEGAGKLTNDEKQITRLYEWFLFPPAEPAAEK